MVYLTFALTYFVLKYYLFITDQTNVNNFLQACESCELGNEIVEFLFVFFFFDGCLSSVFFVQMVMALAML